MGTSPSSIRDHNTQDIFAANIECCQCRKDDNNKPEIQKRIDNNANFAPTAASTSPTDISGPNFTTSYYSFSRNPALPPVMKSSPKKEPLPLNNWTVSEQRILIKSLNEHPEARKSKEYRTRLVQRAQHQLPGKSLEEIERCYDHVLSTRALPPPPSHREKKDGSLQYQNSIMHT